MIKVILRPTLFVLSPSVLLPLVLATNLTLAQASELNPLWHGTWKPSSGGTALKIDSKKFGDCQWIVDASTLGGIKKKGCWALYLGTKSTEELVALKGALLPRESQEIATKMSKATSFRSVVITNTDASGAEQASGECAVSYFYDQIHVYGRSLCKSGAQMTLYLDRYDKQ